MLIKLSTDKPIDTNMQLKAYLAGERMLTTDNHECTWDLYKSISSLSNEGKTVLRFCWKMHESCVSNNSSGRKNNEEKKLFSGMPRGANHQLRTSSLGDRCATSARFTR